MTTVVDEAMMRCPQIAQCSHNRACFLVGGAVYDD